MEIYRKTQLKIRSKYQN